MTAREPQEIAQLATDVGTKKARIRWDRVLVSSFRSAPCAQSQRTGSAAGAPRIVRRFRVIA